MRYAVLVVLVTAVFAGCLSPLTGETSFSSVEKSYSVEHIVEVGGELAVLGQANGTTFIKYSGERYGSDVYVANPGVFEVGGRLAYVFSEPGTANDSLWYDGTVHGGRFNEVWSPVLVDGKLVFQAQVGTGQEQVIVRGGKIIDDRYSVSTSPAAVDGRLAYEAFEDGNEYIVHGDRVYGPYDRVNSPEEVAGELGYWYRNGSGYVYRLGNRQLKTEQRLVRVLTIDGKVTAVTANGTDVSIRVGDRTYGQDTGLIYPSSVIGVGSVPAYLAEVNGTDRVVLGNAVVDGNYTVTPDAVGDHIAAIGGRLVFAAQEGRDWHVYRQQ
ncbi:MAG: hypothetical protein SV186_01495 [Candidatus Nanohaloarchaea archaeon]|nr:hypothetical protein [Candidatus Nanohaloarchaea archaeon]